MVLPSDDPNRPTGDEEQAARNAVRYDRLLALLDRDQRRPWMVRAVLGREPIGDDQAERAALLGGLDRLAADSPAQADL